MWASVWFGSLIACSGEPRATHSLPSEGAGGILATAGAPSAGNAGASPGAGSTAGAGGNNDAMTGGAGRVAGSGGEPGFEGLGPSYEPADGRTLVVVGQDTASIESYASEVGPMPAGVMLYTSIRDLAGVSYPADFGAGNHDLSRWATHPSKFVLQIGLSLVNALDDVTNGSLDANIDTLIGLLANTGRPVFLRVGYEFDSDWAAYEPDSYRPAFRRIASRIREKGAGNVVMVWHAWGYFHSFGQGSVDPWYPGDDYVDWVAVSRFPGWDEASALSAGSAQLELAAFAKAHQKPLMIAESAPKQVFQPSLGEASWKGWFEPTFAFIETHDVKLFSYINANWDVQPLWAGQGWGDTRVQSNEIVLDAWRKKLSEPRFLHSEEALY